MKIRTKLIIGFGILVFVFSVTSAVTLIQINYLGNSIDLILKENYLSVAATQNIINGSNQLLLSFKDTPFNPEKKWIRYKNALDVIREGIEIEVGNITLEGEEDLANEMKNSFLRLEKIIPQDKNKLLSFDFKFYASKIENEIQTIIRLASEISSINQKNMIEAKEEAKKKSDSISKLIWITLAISFFTSLCYLYLSNYWILKPLKILTDYSKEIKKGNFDLSYTKLSNDEIGKLGIEFNNMIFALRNTRDENQKTISRTKHAVTEVFKSIPIPLTILDSEGKIEISTEKATNIFGFHLGNSIWNNNIKALKDGFTSVLENGVICKNKEGEYIQIFHERDEYFYEFQIIPIYSNLSKSQLSGAAICLNDVTSLIEQKELKKSVLSTVSHQIKSPLTTIQMAFHMILDERIGELNSKQTEVMLAAKNESDRLEHIINEILDLSKMESKKSILNKTKISPYDLVEICKLDSIDHANRKGVKIYNDVNIKSFTIDVDIDKMKHVFSNIFSNGIRFTPSAGIIRINATVLNNIIEFSISDTGAGISAEDLPYIFDSFYRGSGQEPNTGVGIGLTIVKEIIQLHGGNVRCRSEVGVGTTFAFTIPIT